MIIEFLKNLIAGKELAELERWRVANGEARRWLAESQEANIAIDYVAGVAAGSMAFGHVVSAQSGVRAIRMIDESSIIRLTSAEVTSGLDRVRWAEGLIRQLPEDHDGRNSWLLNYGRDPKLTDKRDGR